MRMDMLEIGMDHVCCNDYFTLFKKKIISTFYLHNNWCDGGGAEAKTYLSSIPFLLLLFAMVILILFSYFCLKKLIKD